MEGHCGESTSERIARERREEYWQRVGHRIQRCDASTGHMVRDVALCDSDETAKRIIASLKKE